MQQPGYRSNGQVQINNRLMLWTDSGQFKITESHSGLSKAAAKFRFSLQRWPLRQVSLYYKQLGQNQTHEHTYYSTTSSSTISCGSQGKQSTVYIHKVEIVKTISQNIPIFFKLQLTRSLKTHIMYYLTEMLESLQITFQISCSD